MTPYYSHAGITIYHGDCRDVLPYVEADVLVTDPPYGTGGRRRSVAGDGRNPSSSAVVREAWDNGDVSWLSAWGGDLGAVFFPGSRASVLLDEANAVGLTRHRLVYFRKLDPMPQPSGCAPFSTEPVWLLSRGAIPFRSASDQWTGSTPRDGRDADATGHPYQKPLGLLEWLIAALPGETILDPFMGSGTTLVAAKNLGRKAIGIEIEERDCEIAAQRLAQEVMPL